MTLAKEGTSYYVPHGSRWPITGAVALFLMMGGVSTWLNGSGAAKWIALLGLAALIYMLVGWFSDVIGESEGGMYSAQVDRSFRMGMSWFIFSEVMFFAAFFGALFYARQLALPATAADFSAICCCGRTSRRAGQATDPPGSVASFSRWGRSGCR
jgi:cytochrome c oxidase subunit 3